MPRRSVFDEELKIYRDMAKKNPKFLRDYAEWRRIWRAKGPVKFAEEILAVDPNTGGKLTLSKDQKEFLTDVWKKGIRLVIIAAGRGAGKTFALAVYITWRIFTHQNWHIASMGGSAEQTEKIRSYIMGWMRHNDDLYRFKSKMIMTEIKTWGNSSVSFHACSGTSVRGPHTHDLIIDEQAAGEEGGGTKFIKAAIWDVSTSPDIHIIKSSTAHFIHGDFLHTWNNAEALGYKKYRWAIAKHISGEKDPYKTYQDHHSKHWVSNVPWIPDLNIEIFRRNKSNDEWLVEALGGISITSGLVFNPADLNACICDRCLDEGKECIPYKEGHCPIVQYFLQLEGVRVRDIPRSTKQALAQYVKERIEGIDWGKNAPCAYTAVGRFRDIVFVLGSKERVGMSDKEKIDTGDDMAKLWSVDILRPDPREWAYNNALTGRGYAVHELFSFEGGQEKNTYLYNLKRIVERHHLVIPVAFEDLIRSMRNLAFDKRGKVRKADDHSFDSLLYATSYYAEVVTSSALMSVYREMRKRKLPRRLQKGEPRGIGSKNRPSKKKKKGSGFSLW